MPRADMAEQHETVGGHSTQIYSQQDIIRGQMDDGGGE